MKEVTWMMDYLPVRMMALAKQSEARFGECLMNCPKEGDVIKIDDRETFTRLLEHRITSLLLSVASLEAYLGYYAYQTALEIEEKDPGVKVHDYLAKQHLEPMLKEQPNRIKRRHQMVMETASDMKLFKFMTTFRMSLEEKILYYSLIRTGKLMNMKDGNVKKLFRMMNIYEELLQPNLANATDSGKVESHDGLEKIFLGHQVPETLTLGVSASDAFVIEPYDQEHFFWELLHIYPARAVQEFIQFMHTLDDSEFHFISVISPVALVDDKGEPVKEDLRRYSFEVHMED